MHAFRVLSQIVCKALQAFKWNVGLGIDAELDCRLTRRSAISGITPPKDDVFAFDGGNLVGFLDDEAGIEAPAQTGKVQRVDASALDLDCREP